MNKRVCKRYLNEPNVAKNLYGRKIDLDTTIFVSMKSMMITSILKAAKINQKFQKISNLRPNQNKPKFQEWPVHCVLNFNFLRNPYNLISYPHIQERLYLIIRIKCHNLGIDIYARCLLALSFNLSCICKLSMYLTLGLENVGLK